MAYTVKQLSKLSGVTARALHFYEEEGLLFPAYYGSNGYRYYEEKELLHLQQILFFKELGLTLKQISQIMKKNDFDQIAALHSHRKALSQEWEKIGLLLKTIDKTIEHLKGKKKMKDKEIFDGFNITIVKAKKDQSYSSAEEIVGQSVKNPTTSVEDVKKKGKSYYDNIVKTTHAIFQDLVRCIERGLEPSDEQVQQIIERQYAFMSKMHNMTKEVYQSYAKLYEEHPDFRKQLDPIHPQLAEFMAKAMRAFVEKKLS